MVGSTFKYTDVEPTIILMSGGMQLAFYPDHDDGDYVMLFFSSKGMTGRYVVPFCKTAPAAAACGMLRYEDRMPAHRGLPSVILRLGGCQSACHEVTGMPPYSV